MTDNQKDAPIVGRKVPIHASGPMPPNPLDWPLGNTQFGGVNQGMTLRQFLTMDNRKPARRARIAALDLIERLQATVDQQNAAIAALAVASVKAPGRSDAPIVERVADLASELCDDREARRIARQEHQPNYFDSAPHVQEYWQAIARAAIAALPEVETIEQLREALEWYAEQASGCRKISTAGDPFRQALDRDGGNRARAALSRGDLPLVTLKDTRP